jgi:hypothetical protein
MTFFNKRRWFFVHQDWGVGELKYHTFQTLKNCLKSLQEASIKGHIDLCSCSSRTWITYRPKLQTPDSISNYSIYEVDENFNFKRKYSYNEVNRMLKLSCL